MSKTRPNTKGIVTAGQKFNKRKRLEALNTRLHGTFKNFMTQEDLKIMREDTCGKSVSRRAKPHA